MGKLFHSNKAGNTKTVMATPGLINNINKCLVLESALLPNILSLLEIVLVRMADKSI